MIYSLDNERKRHVGRSCVGDRRHAHCILEHCLYSEDGHINIMYDASWKSLHIGGLVFKKECGMSSR